MSNKTALDVVIAAHKFVLEHARLGDARLLELESDLAHLIHSMQGHQTDRDPALETFSHVQLLLEQLGQQPAANHAEILAKFKRARRPPAQPAPPASPIVARMQRGARVIRRIDELRSKT